MRTLSFVFKILAVAALVLTVSVFVPISSQAAEVIYEGNNATGIEDLNIGGVLYDITFVFDTGENLYGPHPYQFDFTSGSNEEASMEAAIAIREALNAAPVPILTAGPRSTGYFLLAAAAEEADPSTPESTVFAGWESRYDVEAENRPPDVWTATANFNLDIDLFPPGGGIIDITGTPYPFGMNVWSLTDNYTYADAALASGSPPPDDVDIGGSVTGLAGSGLVLQNNGADDESIAVDGLFTFATLLTPGASYSITVATQPSDPVQLCYVANGSGAVSVEGVDDVLVTCADVPPDPPATMLSGYLFANDFDGDKIVDRAVWRARIGLAIIEPSGGGNRIFIKFGEEGDVPATGDYDGDGITDIAGFSDGLWRARLSGGGVVRRILGTYIRL